MLAIGSHAGKLSFAFHGFDQVMGVAVSKDRIAIGTRRQIYFLNPAHEFAPRVEPFGSYDRCWLARSSFVTGRVLSLEQTFRKKFPDFVSHFRARSRIDNRGKDIQSYQVEGEIHVIPQTRSKKLQHPVRSRALCLMPNERNRFGTW
ncbi:MAG TPA: DUF4915 domain-containing protein, partial [Pirellula sp.]|nr:DUF4915 domain-containing protein [Pirellula sp.]